MNLTYVHPNILYWRGKGASTRVANILTRAGLTSVEALRAAGPVRVIYIRGIGGLSITEIAGLAGWDTILSISPPVTVEKVERAVEEETG